MLFFIYNARTKIYLLCYVYYPFEKNLLRTNVFKNVRFLILNKNINSAAFYITYVIKVTNLTGIVFLCNLKFKYILANKKKTFQKIGDSIKIPKI